MTKDELYEKLIWELHFDNGVWIKGTIDKVSQHFADFEGQKLSISAMQPVDVAVYTDEYFKLVKTNPDLTFDDFVDSKF